MQSYDSLLIDLFHNVFSHGQGMPLNPKQGQPVATEFALEIHTGCGSLVGVK